MIERQLTKLIHRAVRESASRDRDALIWMGIGVGAFLLRRSWRQTDETTQVKVKKGRSVTIAVREPVD